MKLQKGETVIERKFTGETKTAVCPLCKKRGCVFFYSGNLVCGSLKIAKLQCSSCNYLVILEENIGEPWPDDKENLRLLLQKLEKVKFPHVVPCRVCGTGPDIADRNAATISCDKCGITVSDTPMSTTIEMWNMLMAKSE